MLFSEGFFEYKWEDVVGAAIPLLDKADPVSV
jgi:hypothetical protein